jgi:hypothetical protein
MGGKRAYRYRQGAPTVRRFAALQGLVAWGRGITKSWRWHVPSTIAATDVSARRQCCHRSFARITKFVSDGSNYENV